MAETPLDEAVKPSPYVTPQQVAAIAASTAKSPARAAELLEAKRPNLNEDPTSHLPSSPPQIYLNLLIMEASLRAQFLSLRARRRQNVFFLLLLSLWNAYFFYGLFLRPREDGQGLGGSVYWVVDMTEKMAFMGGLVTAVLVWGTGQWERGVRWPQRWLSVTNRGLRGMNLKIVILKGPWWRRLLSTLTLVFPYRSFKGVPGGDFQVVDFADKRIDGPRMRRPTAREEDVAPGGDTIKVLLLPKHFSPEFREGWEVYRADYWERENERRAQLRRLVRSLRKEQARQRAGWLYYVGLSAFARAPQNQAKTSQAAAHSHREGRRHRTAGSISGGSFSRSSSRSSSVASVPDDDFARGGGRGSTRRSKLAMTSLADHDRERERDRADRGSRGSVDWLNDKRASTLSTVSNVSSMSNASGASGASAASDSADSYWDGTPSHSRTASMADGGATPRPPSGLRPPGGNRSASEVTIKPEPREANGADAGMGPGPGAQSPRRARRSASPDSDGVPAADDSADESPGSGSGATSPASSRPVSAVLE